MQFIISTITLVHQGCVTKRMVDVIRVEEGQIESSFKKISNNLSGYPQITVDHIWTYKKTK